MSIPKSPDGYNNLLKWDEHMKIMSAIKGTNETGFPDRTFKGFATHEEQNRFDEQCRIDFAVQHQLKLKEKKGK